MDAFLSTMHSKNITDLFHLKQGDSFPLQAMQNLIKKDCQNIVNSSSEVRQPYLASIYHFISQLIIPLPTSHRQIWAHSLEGK